MTFIRLLTGLFVVVLMGGCALLPRGHWHDMHVIASTDYCGTPSQASSVDYFATPSAFGKWIAQRNLSAFKPDMANGNGVIVAEMGQRASSGYNIKLLPDHTHIKNNTLTIAMKWTAPGLNAHVSDALNSRCIAFSPPKGDYNRVKLVDQLGNKRGEAKVNRPSSDGD